MFLLNPNTSGGGGGGSVNSVTGTVVDNTDPTNPVINAATEAQGALADSAVQPGDLATVATTGAYSDLSGTPTLGTASAEDVGYFATAAQGALADSALQPGDNVSTLTNDAGYLTAESDTLSSVTGRGASTSTESTFSGGIISTQVKANSSAGGKLKTNSGDDSLDWGNGGSANGTLYGGWNLDGGTANTILSLGASKTLTSLDTSTYPSLTELSYGKGVTSAIQTQINNKQSTSEKNSANGYAGLDAGGKINSAQLPDLAISDFLGNFTDTTAALADAGVQASQKGDWFTVDTSGGQSWIVTTSSPTTLSDITQLKTPTSAVTSVFSRTGAVTAQSGDYTASQVTNAFDKTTDDTDDITVGTTNKFATASEKTKLGFISVTQAVDLDTMESDIATNNAKVTNATHSGDMTGDTALTAQPAIITGKSSATVASGDLLLIADINDSNNLKQVTAQSIADLGGASGATTALDNLASVAINTSLVSDTDNTDDLGTALKKWANLFVTTIGATATRVTKGWFTDLEVTNAIAGSVTGNAGTATALQAARTIGTATGDVTSAGSSFNGSANNTNAYTIASGAVTLAKMANLAQDQFIGRTSASTGVPQTATITAAARTVLDDTTVANMVNTLGGATSTGSGGLVRANSPTLVTPAAFTTGGTITLAENTGIALDPAGSADGKWTGITITATAGYTQAFGDLVYLSSVDSRWELADCDAATTSDRMLAMVIVAGTDGTACTLLLQGIIRADSKFPTLTIGSPVYVGETAGEIQVAIPTGADNVIRRVGYALTADELYFCPSMDSQITVS